MSRTRRRPVLVPASARVDTIASALEIDVAELISALEQLGEMAGAEDLIDSDAITRAALLLGIEVSIEPRDLALELLYEREASGNIRASAGRAADLVTGILADLDGLDHRIEEVSEHWSVSRMPVIDRNILRIALFELESETEVPTAVIVSEAVRLANTYSTEKSAYFVNGVLAALARTTRE